MSSYTDNYFQDMRNHMQQKMSEDRRRSEAIARQNSTRNQKVLVIKDGQPLFITSDSNGNVWDIEVCNDTSYMTRNAIYNADKVVYDKFINGDFRHSQVDSVTKATLKGQPLDVVTASLQEIKVNG